MFTQNTYVGAGDKGNWKGTKLMRSGPEAEPKPWKVLVKGSFGEDHRGFCTENQISRPRRSGKRLLERITKAITIILARKW